MSASSEMNTIGWDPMRPFATSIRCLNNSALFAVALGDGVYRKGGLGQWEKAGHGLPEGSVVNRLQTVQQNLFACTSKGLFIWLDGQWKSTGLLLPCYQVISDNGLLAAATMYGVWCKEGGNWMNLAAPHSYVYDLIAYPDYLILGTDRGISIYDRSTYEWVHYPQQSAVTGLAVFQRSVMGVTDTGALLIGDQQGGFLKAAFSDLCIYTISSIRGNVYVCTERGLFQLGSMGIGKGKIMSRGAKLSRSAGIASSLILKSLGTGLKVTDIDFCGDDLYMATLGNGVQRLEDEAYHSNLS